MIKFDPILGKLREEDSGSPGADGADGVGVPTGGTTGQVLKKASNDDFDTEWGAGGSGAVDSVNGQTGTVVLDASDVGAAPTLGTDDNYVTDAEKTKLSNLSGTNTGDQDLSGLMVKSSNLSDLSNASTARTNLGLGTAATTDTGTSSGNVPILDGDGKLNINVLPGVALTDTFVVVSQAAMLALTAETGDVAVRTDLNKSFILKGASASTLADWQELLTPTDNVHSVFGRQGTVTAQTNDYTWAQVNKATSSLADITTRSYNDLQNLPTLGTLSTQDGTFSGGGTLATGGFSLTVPATGTAALLATAQTFTALQTITVNSNTFSENMALRNNNTGTSAVSVLTIAAQDGGYQVGRTGPSTTAWPNYGGPSEAFFYAGLATLGLNIVAAKVSGGAAPIRFYSGTSASGTATMAIAGQLVGIGTTTPGARLDINNSSGSNRALDVQGASGQDIARFRTAAGADAYIVDASGHGVYAGNRVIGVSLPTYNNGETLTIDIVSAINRAVVLDISIGSQRSGGTTQFALLKQIVGFRAMASGQNAIIAQQSTVINQATSVTITTAVAITNGIRITLASTANTMDRNSLLILASTTAALTVTATVA